LLPDLAGETLAETSTIKGGIVRIRLLRILALFALVSCSETATDNDTTSETPTASTSAPPEAAGPLDDRGDLELVETDVSFTELEGPQWDADQGVLFFSDVGANTVYQLGADGQITVFRKPSRFANGLALDAEGRLLAAEAGAREVTRTEADGTVHAIASRFHGARLNQPNDIAVRSDGTIYFTDPTFGDAESTAELDFRGVFRITPDGKLMAEHRGDTTEAPNGVVLSPDERLLYVSDYVANAVRVFDVAANGSLSDARPLADVAGPDGVAVDEVGNLYVASYDGGAVQVFTPDGESAGTINMPESPSNCAFGGDDLRTLYITTGTGLYRTTLAAPGLP
jgi:gluconolactonase